MPYDYDEFVRRLRAIGVEVRTSVVLLGRHEVEVFRASRAGHVKTFQDGPPDRPLAPSVVRSVVAGLHLTADEVSSFEVPSALR